MSVLTLILQIVLKLSGSAATCGKEQLTEYLSKHELFENINIFTWNEISQFESGLSQEAAGEETQRQTSGAQGEKLPLVRSYYQFNTASCPKLRSEVWSGNLKYCAGRPRGNRLCRTFSFFSRRETSSLAASDYPFSKGLSLQVRWGSFHFRPIFGVSLAVYSQRLLQYSREAK